MSYSTISVPDYYLATFLPVVTLGFFLIRPSVAAIARFFYPNETGVQGIPFLLGFSDLLEYFLIIETVKITS